jgi:hypothetical protein
MIQRIQSAKGATAGATNTTFTIALGATPKVGNVVIVAFGAKVSTIMDVKVGGIPALEVFPAINTTGVVFSSIFYCPINPAVASANVVFTNNATGSAVAMSGVAVEYSGNYIQPDTAGAGNTGSSTTPTTNSVVTNYASEVVVGAMVARASSLTTEQTNWLTLGAGGFSTVLQTSTTINVASGEAMTAFVERIVSATGTYSQAGTISPTNQWACSIVSFREGVRGSTYGQ